MERESSSKIKAHVCQCQAADRLSAACNKWLQIFQHPARFKPIVARGTATRLSQQAAVRITRRKKQYYVIHNVNRLKRSDHCYI